MKRPGMSDRERLRLVGLTTPGAKVKEVVRLLQERPFIRFIATETDLDRRTVRKIKRKWQSGDLNDLAEDWGLPLKQTASLWRAGLQQALSAVPTQAHVLFGDSAKSLEAVLSLGIPASAVEDLTAEEIKNFKRLQESLQELKLKLEELGRRSNQAQEELGWPTNPAVGQPGFLPAFADSISQELLMCCGQFETASCCGGHAGGRYGYRRKPTSFDGYFMLKFECRGNWEIALGGDDALRRCEEIHRQVFEECKPIANALLRLHRQVNDLKHLLRLAASTPAR